MANTLLESTLVGAVVDRLTPGIRPRVNLAGLTAIYEAWCSKVPFDNLHKRISLEKGDPLLPGDDPSQFFRSWLDYSAGGTCWAGSNALFSLLRSLGFTARRAVATMHLGQREPPNHGTVIVDLKQHSYLVDTSMLHRLPLPLPEDTANPHESDACSLVWERRGRSLSLRWQPLHMPEGCLCTLLRSSVSHRRFFFENQATRRWSPFNFSLHARILRADTTVGIAEGHLVRIGADGSWKRTPLTFAESLAFLERELGVSRQLLRRLPPNRPTPPPPKRDEKKPITSFNEESCP